MDVIPLSFSMTGYGQSSLQFAGYKITFEVKSVNHRYCEVVLRMPRDWMVYEDVLKRKVQQHIKRGRVDVVINRERDEEAVARPVLSRAAVKSYLESADVLKREFGLSGELTLRDLLSLPGVMESREETAGLGPVSPEALSEVLEDGLEQSLQSLMEMRVREGSHLSGDLEQRLNHLERLHADMTELAPGVVGEYRDKLRQRLGELADGTFPFDEHKFGMEVAIFADRCNIDEELTRLHSHFEQCRSLLKGKEPAGRKLDFLIQEMNRETNTIGSKCNHLTLAGCALEMKAELEKIREQAANLE